MARQRKLLVEHLENVSGKVLDTYPDAIRDLIRRRAGVYALYRREKLYYVGLARNLMGRLRSHRRDRHNGYWDRFSVYLTRRDEQMRELEALVLRIAEPAGNKVKGKLAGSRNLLSSLSRHVMEADSRRRKELLGKRRRRGASSRNARDVLSTAFRRRKALRGWNGDYEYSATVLSDGSVRYGKRVYDSPNAAGRAALRKRCNGWRFWHYRDRRGEWIPLRTLKGR